MNKKKNFLNKRRSFSRKMWKKNDVDGEEEEEHKERKKKKIATTRKKLCLCFFFNFLLLLLFSFLSFFIFFFSCLKIDNKKKKKYSYWKKDLDLERLCLKLGFCCYLLVLLFNINFNCRIILVLICLMM